MSLSFVCVRMYCLEAVRLTGGGGVGYYLRCPILRHLSFSSIRNDRYIEWPWQSCCHEPNQLTHTFAKS